MGILTNILEVIKTVLMCTFGLIFMINLILIFAKKNEDGFQVELLTIAYMIVSLLAIITIKIL